MIFSLFIYGVIGLCAVITQIHNKNIANVKGNPIKEVCIILLWPIVLVFLSFHLLWHYWYKEN